eukprot:950900-Pleurochrysis_carterae.AAC.17
MTAECCIRVSSIPHAHELRTASLYERKLWRRSPASSVALLRLAARPLGHMATPIVGREDVKPAPHAHERLSFEKNAC